MEILIYIYLFILWSLFWSFSSVIIDRLKNKKSWIISWRSECPKCKHKLSFYDLFPIFSFLSTKWKCRYCKTKISPIYPILEISTWVLFLLTAYFLIDLNLILSWNLIEIYKLWFFLLLWFFTIVYVFYDILYLEIPESILLILISITFITVSLQSIIPNFEIINILPIFSQYMNLKDIYILIFTWIFMIWWIYFIMLKWLKEIYDIAILVLIWLVFVYIKYFLYINLEQYAIWSAILSSFFIFLFLYLQILLSWWTWMWWWDLRIALLIWLLAWLSFSFYAVLASYMSWSIIWIWIIIYQKTKNHYIEQKKFLNKFRNILWVKPKKISLETKMPFGPFLAIWIYVILFFNEKISTLINYL